MYYKATVQNYFTKKRYRVQGVAAGFYLLQEISEDNRFTGKKKTVLGLLMPLIYRVVEPVSLGRLIRNE